MKKILGLMTVLGFAVLSSCSGGETLLDVSVSSAIRPVIPAPAASCLAKKIAASTATAVTNDIAAAYFTVPQITFTPLHTNRDIYISSISIKFSAPGTGGELTCDLGGDALAALKTEWYDSSLKEAKILAGAALAARQTDCPIYCGGIDKEVSGYTTTAVMKIYGYEQNPDDINDATGFTVQSYVTFGKQE